MGYRGCGAELAVRGTRAWAASAARFICGQGAVSRELGERYAGAGIQVASWHLPEARSPRFEVDAPQDVTKAESCLDGAGPRRES
jgi:hypothetical protein